MCALVTGFLTWSLPISSIARSRRTMNFVTHLECSLTGEHYPKDKLLNLSKAGKPLLVRYDLDRVKAAARKEDLLHRGPDMWRLHELLPMRQLSDIVSLGEPLTPLVSLPRMQKRLGGGAYQVRAASRMPPGSFNPRGLAIAVTMAQS